MPARQYQWSKQIAKAFIKADIAFKSYLFFNNEFPECDFQHRDQAEIALGRYTIETAFYDAGYNKVRSAPLAGRYGAVVEIKPEDGRVTKRFRTLFRCPDKGNIVEYGFHPIQRRIGIELCKRFGIASKATDHQAKAVRRYLEDRLWQAICHDPDAAILFAFLHENSADIDRVDFRANATIEDRKWWLGLKRKLYAADKQFVRTFICPRSISEAKPVLREDNIKKAGMTPAGISKIHAVCKKWADDSNEAFALCIARHSVICFHQAYGRRAGKPMTLTTKSWMASLTKLITGAGVIMAVDQRLFDLEDRVDMYLAPFRGIDVKKHLTIRHLYTHTNSLWGHWGDEFNDLEERLADYYPYMRLGFAYDYNSVDFALMGKIMETVTGEALPCFFRKHLFEPLGCKHTEMTSAGGGAWSIPMDMAKIGQLLLNKGSYGRMRFFSEESYYKILPQKLTDILGSKTTEEIGVGTAWYKDGTDWPLEGLAPGAFGHPAASQAIMRVDPVNDLVIVVTRNAGGAHFDEYRRRFFAAVAGGLNDQNHP